MVETVLDVVRAAFGEDLGPSLLRRVEECGLPQLDRFRVCMNEFVRRAAVPSKDRDEMRPYVNLWQPGKPEARPAVGGLALRYNSTDLDDADRVTGTVEALKHHLLYCHSIAIDDPLDLLLDWFEPEQARVLSEDTLIRHRRRLLNYLNFLGKVAPLVEQEILVFVEPNYLYPFWYDSYALTSDPYNRPDFLRSYVREVGPDCPPAHHNPELTEEIANDINFSDSPGNTKQKAPARKKRPKVPPPDYSDILEGRVSREWLLVADAEELIGTALVVQAFHDDRLDLFFPHHYVEEVFYKLVRPAATSTETEQRWLYDLHMLRRVVSIELPTLGQLELPDIVAIRQGEDAFEQWRDGLSDVLRTLSESSNPYVERRAVHYHLHSQEANLRSELQKSGFLGQLRGQGRRFAIGVAASSAFVPLIGPAAFAVGAGISGVTGLANALFSYFTGTHKRRVDAALYHHHLLFDPDPRPRP